MNPAKTALIGVVGQSGAGKTMALRNIPQDRMVLINVERKLLPFKWTGPPENHITVSPFFRARSATCSAASSGRTRRRADPSRVQSPARCRNSSTEITGIP